MNCQQYSRATIRRHGFTFSLANGDHWVVAAEDWDRAQIVPALAQMFQAPEPVQIEAESATLEVGIAEGMLRHRILQDFKRLQTLTERPASKIVIHERVLDVRLVLPVELTRLLYAIAFHNELKQGFLLHGVLLERLGRGVVLVGPSGRGKTTAARRVAPPWKALSDDAVLVGHDQARGFRVHPWPAGRALHDRRLTYDVKCDLPLEGIFLLMQSDQEKVVRLDQSRAVGVLCESAKQTFLDSALELLPPADLREFQLRRFDSICALAKTVPAYLLHLTLTSPFWDAIEPAIEDGRVDRTG